MLNSNLMMATIYLNFLKDKATCIKVRIKLFVKEQDTLNPKFKYIAQTRYLNWYVNSKFYINYYMMDSPWKHDHYQWILKHFKVDLFKYQHLEINSFYMLLWETGTTFVIIIFCQISISFSCAIIVPLSSWSNTPVDLIMAATFF